MKRSKKGKPMTYCIRCGNDTVDVTKFGGIICAQCHIIKRNHNFYESEKKCEGG